MTLSEMINSVNPPPKTNEMFSANRIPMPMPPHPAQYYPDSIIIEKKKCITRTMVMCNVYIAGCNHHFINMTDVFVYQIAMYRREW